MKRCASCEVLKPKTEYKPSNKNEDGLTKVCVPCLDRQRKYYAENAEVISEKSKVHYVANAKEIISKAREYSIANADTKAEYIRKYYLENKEKLLEQNRVYRENNPGLCRAIRVNRLHKKKQRFPLWADKDKIKEVYDNVPKGYHVDHIIPLQGSNVSGLHVHNNLQYLTEAENCSKKNKFDPETFSGP